MVQDTWNLPDTFDAGTPRCFYHLQQRTLDIWKARSIGSRAGRMVGLESPPGLLHFGLGRTRGNEYPHYLRGTLNDVQTAKYAPLLTFPALLHTPPTRPQPHSFMPGVLAPVAPGKCGISAASARPDGRFPRNESACCIPTYEGEQPWSCRYAEEAGQAGRLVDVIASKGTVSSRITTSINPSASISS